MTEQSGNEKTIILSLGGSIIFPDTIDTQFLSNFKKLIEEKVIEGYKFVIICGGGKICRMYQEAAGVVNTFKLEKEHLDWIGIHTTRLNAQLVKSIFLPNVETKIIKDPFEEGFNFEKPIIIGAGWKPGSSTDYDAVCMAERFGSKKIINLSNVDYVYTADPRVHTDAKRIENISWAEYRKLIPEEWEPGLSTPFDPIASKKAEELNVQVCALNGHNFDSVRKAINGEKFEGSIIG